MPGAAGSQVTGRQLLCESHVKVKRMKQERGEDNQRDSYGSEPSPSRRTVTPPTLYIGAAQGHRVWYPCLVPYQQWM